MAMTRETKSAVFASVISAAIVSTAGGAFGTFVAFKILEYRVEAMEKRQTQDRALIDGNKILVDERLGDLKEDISKIGGDVQYIRGRLEGPIHTN